MNTPFIVAGPCALERDEVNLAVAETLAELKLQLGVPVYFKGSFDKANRARLDAPRGPGLEAGLEALRRVRERTGLPIVTDVHEPHQVGPTARVVDVVQVPAFLCRQTDLLVAAGASGRVVNIKKGQWMAPEEMHGAVEKVRGSGAESIWVTERGTAFGYGDLIVDMRSFVRLRQATNATIVFDATHSVQLPGRGALGASGGSREFVRPLAMAAAAAGADGFYLETHPDPSRAPSDGATMVPLAELLDLVEAVLTISRHLRVHADA